MRQPLIFPEWRTRLPETLPDPDTLLPSRDVARMNSCTKSYRLHDSWLFMPTIMLDRSLLTVGCTARVEIVGPGSTDRASLLEYDEFSDGGSMKEVNSHAHPWSLLATEFTIPQVTSMGFMFYLIRRLR